MLELRKVPLNKDRLLGFIETFADRVDVEFPELREMMGVGEGEVPVLTIKAASLNDHIRAQTLYEQVAIMAVKMMGWAAGEKVEEPIDYNKMITELKEPMNAKTYLEISLFHRCVLNPKFSMRESVKISEALPEVVNRVASEALRLSSLETGK